MGLFYMATKKVARSFFMKNKRDLKGLKNIVFSFVGLEAIQVLTPVKKVSDVESGLTEKNAFINQWAIGIGKGEALNLDRFLKYCKSQTCTFTVKDVITLNDFKNYSTYTLKAVTTGHGLKKVIDGQDCFFCVYRQVEDGRILGTWLPYDAEMQKMLNVKVLSSDDLAELKEKRERKQLEALLAKYGK